MKPRRFYFTFHEDGFHNVFREGFAFSPAAIELFAGAVANANPNSYVLPRRSTHPAVRPLAAHMRAGGEVPDCMIVIDYEGSVTMTECNHTARWTPRGWIWPWDIEMETLYDWTLHSGGATSP